MRSTYAPGSFLTREEFDETMQKTAQKSEDITDIMVREFDKVYARFDAFEAAVDARFNTLGLRVNRLDENMRILNGNVVLIMRYLGIPEGQALL